MRSDVPPRGGRPDKKENRKGASTKRSERGFSARGDRSIPTLLRDASPLVNMHRPSSRRITEIYGGLRISRDLEKLRRENGIMVETQAGEDDGLSKQMALSDIVSNRILKNLEALRVENGAVASDQQKGREPPPVRQSLSGVLSDLRLTRELERLRSGVSDAQQNIKEPLREFPFEREEEDLPSEHENVTDRVGKLPYTVPFDVQRVSYPREKERAEIAAKRKPNEGLTDIFRRAQSMFFFPRSVPHGVQMSNKRAFIPFFPLSGFVNKYQTLFSGMALRSLPVKCGETKPQHVHYCSALTNKKKPKPLLRDIRKSPLPFATGHKNNRPLSRDLVVDRSSSDMRAAAVPFSSANFQNRRDGELSQNLKKLQADVQKRSLSQDMQKEMLKERQNAQKIHKFSQVKVPINKNTLPKGDNKPTTLQDLEKKRFFDVGQEISKKPINVEKEKPFSIKKDLLGDKEKEQIFRTVKTPSQENHEDKSLLEKPKAERIKDKKTPVETKQINVVEHDKKPSQPILAKKDELPKTPSIKSEKTPKPSVKTSEKPSVSPAKKNITNEKTTNSPKNKSRKEKPHPQKEESEKEPLFKTVKASLKPSKTAYQLKRPPAVTDAHKKAEKTAVKNKPSVTVRRQPEKKFSGIASRDIRQKYKEKHTSDAQGNPLFGRKLKPGARPGDPASRETEAKSSNISRPAHIPSSSATTKQSALKEGQQQDKLYSKNNTNENDAAAEELGSSASSGFSAGAGSRHARARQRVGRAQEEKADVKEGMRAAFMPFARFAQLVGAISLVFILVLVGLHAVYVAGY